MGLGNLGSFGAIRSKYAEAATKTLVECLVVLPVIICERRRRAATVSFAGMCRVRSIEEARHRCVPALQGPMEEAVWIAPVQSDPGLIAYKCPSCGYVTSVLIAPQSGDQ
jgi:hypothetical protein